MKKLSPNDRKYIAEYRRWFDKLPERQKAIMKKQGLDKPHIDDYTTRQAFDISDIQIADTSRDEEPDGAKVFSERDFRCRFAEFADVVFEEILRRKTWRSPSNACVSFSGKAATAPKAKSQIR